MHEYPNVGELNLLAIEYLKKYKELGGKLILFTCRTDYALLVAVSACEKAGLYFDAINNDLDETINTWIDKHPESSISNKPCYDMLIDDKNYPCCFRGIDWVSLSYELLKEV